MWRKRILSCLLILNFGLGQNFLPELGTQVLGCAQVDFAPREELG